MKYRIVECLLNKQPDVSIMFTVQIQPWYYPFGWLLYRYGSSDTKTNFIMSTTPEGAEGMFCLTYTNRRVLTWSPGKVVKTGELE